MAPPPKKNKIETDYKNSINRVLEFIDNHLDSDLSLNTIAKIAYFSPFHFELNEFEKSWTGLFLWMNENGYSKAERNPFEIYHNNFNEHPEGKFVVDFYVPITM
jgi:AraC family transcriptional regulator